MNDWQNTAQVLREAYGAAQVSGISSVILGFQHNRSLFQSPIRSPRPPAINPLASTPVHSPTPVSVIPALGCVPYPKVGAKRLSVSVSVGNVPERKNLTVRRQRVNFMNGSYQVSHDPQSSLVKGVGRGCGVGVGLACSYINTCKHTHTQHVCYTQPHAHNTSTPTHTHNIYTQTHARTHTYSGWTFFQG